MEEMYYYWLHNVPGIGRITLGKILSLMSPKELYERNSEHCKDFLTKTQRQNIDYSKSRWDLKKEWEVILGREIQLSYQGKANYPEKLKTIQDAPPLLYLKGKEEILRKPSVAVIGARACSNYGSFMAKELGRELAKMGIVVVSGMARGIDSICQWTGLESGGESIGVLGSGVEICYPPENQRLFERLPKQGCLVSENPPFTKPSAGLFPLRNRIISGLSDVVVVIEAREKSGTLITVDMALEQGREVYALPGRTTDTVSQGCNRLIKQGAGMILTPGEFLEEIAPMLRVKYQGEEVKNQQQMSREEKRVLSVMDVSLMSMEEIYQKVKHAGDEIALSKVMEIVMELRIKGMIEEENGYYFQQRFGLWNA